MKKKLDIGKNNEEQYFSKKQTVKSGTIISDFD